MTPAEIALLTVLAMACIAYPFVRAVWRRK